ERARHLTERGRHLRRSSRLHVDVVHEAGELGLDAERIHRSDEERIGGRRRRGRRRDAQHLELPRRERDEHRVVLILTESGLSLARQDSDHLHRDALHEHGRADRVLMLAEEILQHRLAEETHAGGVALVGLGERASRDHRPVPDREIARRDSLDAGAPVLVAVLDLRELPVEIADRRDRTGASRGSGWRPAATAGSSFRMASASATVSVEALPNPARTPLLVVAPGSTTSRLVPRLAICASTAALAPCPTATMAIRAATPMNTPRTVSAERSLLRASVRAAATSAMRPKDHAVPKLGAAVSRTAAAALSGPLGATAWDGALC